MNETNKNVIKRRTFSLNEIKIGNVERKDICSSDENEIDGDGLCDGNEVARLTGWKVWLNQY